VIDESTDIMYFVTRTVEGSSTVQRLRAIDTRTGGDRMSPVVISATSFSSSLNNQRPGLALANNWMSLNNGDLDLGSSGPVFLPGTNLLVIGGKGGGKGYLIDSNNPGHLVNGDTQIRQVFQAVELTNRTGVTYHIHNSMVTWNSPQGLNLYVWGENDIGNLVYDVKLLAME